MCMSWKQVVFPVIIFLVFLLSFIPAAVSQTWISGVDVATTMNEATIQWVTAVPANSQIKYGTNGNYGRRNNLDPALRVVHGMTLGGLSAGRAYHFRVLAADASGALVTSMDYMFTTAPLPIAVSVTPVTATVASEGTLQFSATVSNSSDASVTWKTTAGTVSSGGLFQAPMVTLDQTVTVTAISVTDPTKSNSATVTVKTPAAVLAVSPPMLSFSAQQGGANPEPANISVTNTGGGALTFAVSTDAAWLSVSPPSGSVPSSPQVAIGIAGLGPGTYSGHVTVSAVGTTGSSVTVAVTLTITAPPVAHSVDLSWSPSASSNVVAYNAYRSTTAGGPYTLLASAIAGVTYTDHAVLPGTTFFYVVTAVDDAALESGYSMEAKAAVPSP
jgi:hypothetical protein